MTLVRYNLHTIKLTHLKQYVIFTKATTPLKTTGRSDQKKDGLHRTCLPVLFLWREKSYVWRILEDVFWMKVTYQLNQQFLKTEAEFALKLFFLSPLGLHRIKNSSGRLYFSKAGYALQQF